MEIKIKETEIMPGKETFRNKIIKVLRKKIQFCLERVRASFPLYKQTEESVTHNIAPFLNPIRKLRLQHS